MKKLLFLIFLLPTLCYAQKSEDYWVYIKDRVEIVSSDRIAGTSQKGDIVDIIPCSRLGRNEPSELEKKEWLIIKVSGITEAERNAMLAPYTETKTETQTFETERTITTDEWEAMQDKGDYSPFVSKPINVSADWTAKGNILIDRVAVKGTIAQDVQVTTTLAYRKRKIDVDSYKTTQSIDSKTSFVTTAVSKTAVVTTEKTATDISAMQREARLYDRTMPLRQLVKWGWEKILSSAYAATTTHTVNRGRIGGVREIHVFNF